MFLRRLACSFLAVSLLGGLAVAAPTAQKPAYDYEDDLAAPRFAQAPEDRPAPEMTAVVLDRAEVRALLAERRKQNLALFRAYRTGGVYPHNFESDGLLNVWLDPEGHLCAAATIIANSGHRDLAMSVPDENNYLRLADVTDGELMDWMLTSGFTQDELALIQRPFMGEMKPLPAPDAAPDRARLAEDARLAKLYAKIDRTLVKQSKKSLELAVERLMANPELAAELVMSTKS